MRYSEPHMLESLKDHVLEEIIEPAPVTHPRFKPGQTIRVFRCGRPDAGTYSAVLVFTPYGIGISGDIILGGRESHHGVWSTGYTLDWFASNLDEHYLCSKFYREVWQTEVAIRWCRRHAQDIRTGEHDHEYKALRSARDGFDGIAESLTMLDRDLKEWSDSPNPEENDDIRQIQDEKKTLLTEHTQIEKDMKGIREQYAEKFDEIAAALDAGDLGDVRGFVEELERIGYNLDGYCPGYDFPLAEAGWLCALQKKFSELYQAKYAAPVAAQEGATGP